MFIEILTGILVFSFFCMMRYRTKLRKDKKMEILAKRRIFMKIRENENTVENIPRDINYSSSSHPTVVQSQESNFYVIHENAHHCDDITENNVSPDDEQMMDDNIHDEGSGSSDDTDVQLDENDGDFKYELASTFLSANINHTQGDKILRLLRTHHCFHNLPCSTKTLLKTPRVPLETIKMDTGEYYHIGLTKHIMRKLQYLPPNKIPQHIEIDLHTDGMSIHKSTGTQFWPIQFRISNIINDNPSIIGIYMGSKKPSDAVQFFKYFIEEFMNIQKSNGIQLKDRKIPVYLRTFIADAPARAFILNHRHHNSENPCSKCKVIGKSVDRRMCFLTYCNERRTEDDYLNATDHNHHMPHSESALKSIGFHMVSRVPFEYMHLICLGVVKKFLEAIVDNKYAFNSMNKVELRQISSNLLLMRSHTPSEFARRPRPIQDYARFKATEFRQLLLYTGPAVFYGILKRDAYEHFLLLHSACRSLLVSSPNSVDLEYASKAFKLYVENCEHIYGKTFMTFNVHGLLHVVEDVRTLGSLNSYSAFPYEDNMSFFRKYLRNPNNLLQQLHRRLAEEENYSSIETPISNDIKPLHRHTNGPITPDVGHDWIQYRTLQFEHFKLTSGSKRDSCLLLRSGRICEVVNIIKSQTNHYRLIVKNWLNITDFFGIPLGINSSFVGTYKCCNLSDEIISIDLHQILAKCFRMPLNNNEQFGEEESYVITALLSNI